MTKQCSKCQLEKDESCFDKCKNVKSGLYPSCKDCRKQYRIDNSQLLKDSNKEYYERVKDSEQYRETYLKYYAKNRSKKIEYANDYYSNNKTQVIKRQNDWVKRKMEYNPSFKLTQRIRRTIRRTLDRKTSRSIDYVGVKDAEEFLKILTDKCDNKNWLYDGYHIDHIWQVHWFGESLEKNPEKVSRLIHNHKNLRPLPAFINHNRSKLDFTPLLEEDLILYQDFLNSDILEKIKLSFSK